MTKRINYYKSKKAENKFVMKSIYEIKENIHPEKSFSDSSKISFNQTNLCIAYTGKEKFL